MADYPAALVHKSYDGGDPSVNPIGTGPYMPESNEVGVKQVLVKSPNPWWGTAVYGGPYLDRIEYIDFGTDPAAIFAAAGSGEIDATWQTVGDYVEVFDGLGWTQSEAVTAATIAVRFNQDSDLYKDLKRPQGDPDGGRQPGRAGAWLCRSRHHGRKPPRLPDPPGIRRTAPAGRRSGGGRRR